MFLHFVDAFGNVQDFLFALQGDEERIVVSEVSKISFYGVFKMYWWL